MSHVKLKEAQESEDAGTEKERIAQLETSLQKKGNEIKLLLGRIKGYETLTHLFQEAKQQCAQQKKCTEELQYQLGSLQDAHPPRTPGPIKESLQKEHLEPTKTPPASAEKESVPDVPTIQPIKDIEEIDKNTGQAAVEDDKKVTDDVASLVSSQDDYDSYMFDPYAPLLPKKNTKKKQKQGATNPGFVDLSDYAVLDMSSKQATAQERDLSLSFPSLQPKHWSGSGSSSPNSTKNQPPGSAPGTLSSHMGTTDQSNNSQEQTDTMQYYVQKLVDKFQEPPHSSSFVADVVHIVPRAIKMDKHMRLQQIMIDDLTNENNKLRQQIVQAYRTQDARYKTSSSENRKDEKDWVHIEQQPISDSIEGEHPSHVEVMSHLQKKIRTLQTHIQTLGHGKKEADNHAEHLQRDNKSLQQQMDQFKQQDEQRQVEIDMMLMSARKKSEEAENTKAAAVSSLQREKRKSKELHQMLEESRDAERRAQDQVELLHTTSNAGQKLVLKLKEEISALKIRPSSPQYLLSVEDSLPANPGDMKTEIRVLRQQILIYKEDFDRERKDRETAQNDKAALEQELREVKREVLSLKQELRRARDKVLDVEAERDRLDVLAKKKADDLHQLQEQKRNWEERWQQVRQLSQETGQGQGLPGSSDSDRRPLPESLISTSELTGRRHNRPIIAKPTPARNVAQTTWPCIRCTYENLPQRIFCEMCSAKAPHLRADIVTGGNNQVPMLVEQLQIGDPNRDRNRRHGHHQHLVSRGMSGGRLECDQPYSSFNVEEEEDNVVMDAEPDSHSD